MFTLILLFFVPCSQIAKSKLKIPINIEITLKRNFTFDQLIDKNVHVPDNGHSARVAREKARDNARAVAVIWDMHVFINQLIECEISFKRNFHMDLNF